jgi:ribonuclease P protein component
MSTSSFTEHFRFYNRLKRPEEFAAVFSSSKRSSDKFFLFLTINNSTNIARLGLAVPKKNISGAAKRNRVKRIIRESFRLQKERLKGKDVVVFVKKQFDTKQAKIEQTLAKHWDEITK